MWTTTGKLSKAIREFFPADGCYIQALCECGEIPEEVAKKRITAQDRGRWHISIKGLPPVLAKVFGLKPEEVDIVMGKLGAEEAG